MTQSNSICFWIICFPDILKPVGGVKQLHRVSELLVQLGYQSTLIQGSQDFKPGWFSTSAETISFQDFKKIDFGSRKHFQDFLIIPETYVPAISQFSPLLRKIIFNQNSSYTFGLNGEKRFAIIPTYRRYHSPDIEQVWCVSQYDARFLNFFLDIPDHKIKIISNGLETSAHLIKPKKRKLLPICHEKLSAC